MIAGEKPMPKDPIRIGGSVGKAGVMRGVEEALGRPARDFSDHARGGCRDRRMGA